jgi:hypothetical protein
LRNNDWAIAPINRGTTGSGLFSAHLIHQTPPRPTARHYPNLAPVCDLSVIGPPVPPAITVKGRVARIRLAWVHRLEPLTKRFLSRHQAPIRRFYDDRNADIDDRRLVQEPGHGQRVAHW